MTGRSVRMFVASCLLVLLMAAFVSVESFAVRLGNVRITFAGAQYYAYWDLTLLTYRVSRPRKAPDSEWVLGTGECVTTDDVAPFGTPFAWTEHPFVGLWYDVHPGNEYVYISLYGRWDIAPIPVAVVQDEGGSGPEVYVGAIEGPTCQGSWISIQVTDGSHIVFPDLLGAGTYEAEDRTMLRVSSTSRGWALGHAVNLSIPEEASYETVSRIFRISYDPYDAISGTSEIGVSYALSIDESDFSGLPQGTYTIIVTYTATTN